jgi:copper(I)-binding protein
MKMEGDVMKMRPLDDLALPAGKPVQLKPNGYHFMLMDLKAQLKPGVRIPLTLQLRDAKGAQQTIELSLPVAMTPPMAHMGNMPAMGNMGKKP